MAAPGQPTPYWVLENQDGFYYRGYGQMWTTHLHGAVALSEELAGQLARRYPQATIERQVGYEVYPKETFAGVNEPQAVAAIAHAIRLAKADGLSLPTIMVQVEKIYAAKN